MKYAFTNAVTGDLFVKKAPACNVQTLAQALIQILGKDIEIEIKMIGTRHGEKLFESLLSTE